MLIDFTKLFPRWNIQPKGVLHIGANIGQEAAVYDELGIEKVIWIEGNPDLIPQLVKNIAPYKGQVAFNICVSDNEREELFHISNNESLSSSILELGTHKIAHPDVCYINDIKVNTRRIDTLALPLLDVDFLSIDLQGAELMALRGMGDLLRQFKWAYLEVNQAEVYKGCPHVNDLDLFLLGFGFKRVETEWCGNTNWGEALYVINPHNI